MVFVERRNHRSLRNYVAASRAQWAEDMELNKSHAYLPGQNSAGFNRADIDRVLSTHNLLGFISSSSNPLLRSFLPWFMHKIPPIRRSPRARSNLTWVVAYITYLPALLLLALALLGLISIEIQLAALKPTEANAQTQVNQGLASFRTGILDKVNNATYQQSAEYSNSINTVLLNMQNNLNDHMVSYLLCLSMESRLMATCFQFSWVETTSLTLNTSINEFYDGLTGNINSTFSGTVFAAPALDVVHCLIGTKVEGLSTALTWLHENAHITLPQVKENVFALSDDASNELVSSLDGGNRDQSDASSSIVRTLVDQYRRALEKERQIFLFMLGLYGLVVLFALIAVFWHEVVGPCLKHRKGGEAGSEPTVFYTEKSGFEPSINSRSFMAAASAKLAALRPRKRQKTAKSGMTEEEKVAHFQFPVEPFASRPLLKPAMPRSSSGAPAYHNGSNSTANLLAPARSGASPPRTSPMTSKPVMPAAEPEFSLPYLYGDAAPTISPYPARSAGSSGRASHPMNPFVTPFDGPNGS